MTLHIGKDISQDQYQLHTLKLFKHIKKNINKILNIFIHVKADSVYQGGFY